MKKVLVCAAVGALLTGTAVTATAGTADGQGAQKRGLVLTPEDNGDCNASAPTGGSPNGFVILNAPGKSGDTSKILGEVSLKKAPGTYTVELSVGDDNCMPVGTLTTNDQGNGNFHVASPGTGGSYYVVLRNVNDSSQSFASAPVTVR